MATQSITLEKVTLRRVNPSLLRRQVEEILEKGLKGKNWGVDHIPAFIDPTVTNDGYKYEVNVLIQRNSESANEVRELASIKDTLFKVAPKIGGWSLPGHTPNNSPITLNNVDMIADIVIDRGTHFDNLYGLDAQIEVLLAALQIAKDSHYIKRFHTVLHGSPGGGKSEIIRGIKAMVGEQGAIELDGTQSTAAGAINLLMNADILPPILIIEEIEKVQDSCFMWLLSALDGRAEIRKVTNWGVRQRKLPVVCIATVNDLELFQSRHSGALASRFAHKLYCPRPTEETLRRILKREVDSISGNPAWVEPSIRYCMDIEKTTDPRRFVACCLTGRDQLLTGEFQANLIACHHNDN